MILRPLVVVLWLAWAGGFPAWAEEDPLWPWKERQERIRAVVAKATPAVVAVTCDSPIGTGSGVIVSQDGLILSAAHVTDVLEHENKSKEVVIYFADGRRGKAEILGANRTCDEAMLRITEPALQDWPFVELGSSDDVQKGDWMVALGHPGGYESRRPPPVRAGRVWHRDNFGAFFTDCTLTGGDSGGPLLNLDGQLVGIHSSIGGQLTVNRHVAIDQFRLDWDRLLKGEAWGQLVLGQAEPDRPVLGVQLDENGVNGLRLLEVASGGPGDLAGLRQNDVLIQFAGVEVKNYLHFLRLISRREVGDKVEVVVTRNEEVLPTIQVTLASRQAVRQLGLKFSAPPPPKVWLGLEIEDANPGARVLGVHVDSPAAAAGFQFGDIITEMAGQPCTDAVNFARSLGTFEPGTTLTLRVRRQEADVELQATLVAPQP